MLLHELGGQLLPRLDVTRVIRWLRNRDRDRSGRAISFAAAAPTRAGGGDERDDNDRRHRSKSQPTIRHQAAPSSSDSLLVARPALARNPARGAGSRAGSGG